MLNDYHIHALAHGEYKYSYEWLQLFIEKALQQQLNEIGFAEHDEFRHLIDFALVSQLKERFTDIKIKMGLELDYLPGREDEINKIKAEHDWDYLIGSVHFIEGWAFDHPDHKGRFTTDDIDEIYFNYFKLVGKAVEANCFDIVGHFDLVKIWGYRPTRNQLLHYVQPVLESVKDAGIAVEINTSGLRKPVREIYPAMEIINKMKSMNIPILFGSDAHHPEQVGMDIKEAALIAQRAGYNEMVSFSQRKAMRLQIEF